MLVGRFFLVRAVTQEFTLIPLISLVVRKERVLTIWYFDYINYLQLSMCDIN